MRHSVCQRNRSCRLIIFGSASYLNGTDESVLEKFSFRSDVNENEIKQDG